MMPSACVATALSISDVAANDVVNDAHRLGRGAITTLRLLLGVVIAVIPISLM